MPITRHIDSLFGNLFFQEHYPIYINRAHEGFELSEHTHDFIEITYVVEGMGIHYAGEHREQVRRGDLFMIPVGMSHVFRPSKSKEKLTVINCIFSQDLLPFLSEFVPLQDNVQAFQSRLDSAQAAKKWIRLRDENHEWLSIFQTLHMEFTNQRAGFQAVIVSKLIELIIYIQRTIAPAEQHNKEACIPDRMNILLKSIKRHPEYAHSLNDYAEQFGISDRHLSRLIRQYSGMSFTEYVQESRIQACCSLLLQTELPIKEIAARTGYTDLKFFNRLFKNKTGVTPTAYRKQRLLPENRPEA